MVKGKIHNVYRGLKALFFPANFRVDQSIQSIAWYCGSTHDIPFDSDKTALYLPFSLVKFPQMTHHATMFHA